MCRTLCVAKTVGIGYTTSMDAREIRVPSRGMRQTDVHMGREAMSRYIDADALVIDYYDDYETKDDEYSYAYVSEVQIDSAPSIDIVRCKECRHWEMRNSPRGWCVVHQGYVSPQYFCADGEREGE